MEETIIEPVTSENLLDDVEYLFEYASWSKRLGNYIIDRLCIYLVWRFLLHSVNVAVLSVIYRYTYNRAVLYFCGYLFTVGFFVLVQATLEAATGGKTIGKYLTGTRAVTQNGLRISPKTAFLRALCRLVPFEAFSALGTPSYPWHDRWTKTYVIDERLSSLPPEPVL